MKALVCAVAMAVVALGQPAHGEDLLRPAHECDGGTTLTIVPHEDDDLLFVNPSVLHDVQSGRCVRTVFLTAGDAGRDVTYWKGREAGAKAAYADMAGARSVDWTATHSVVGGMTIKEWVLSGKRISLLFLRLPDGGGDGSGFDATGHVSLEKLWNGQVSSVKAIDSSASYTRQGLIDTIRSLMIRFQPDTVNTLDYAGILGDGDHSDHHITGYATKAAHEGYTRWHNFFGYQDYITRAYPSNVDGDDLARKRSAFYAYARHDPAVCANDTDCAGSAFEAWLQRQYRVADPA